MARRRLLEPLRGESSRSKRPAWGTCRRPLLAQPCGGDDPPNVNSGWKKDPYAAFHETALARRGETLLDPPPISLASIEDL